MSRAPVVLCIEWETYVSAVAALETLVGQFPNLPSAPKLNAAVADMHRAHANYLAIETEIHLPALLRRQAT